MSLFDRVLNPPSKNDEKTKKKNIIQSTAGAVPVKNAKGEITMETVRVKRYVAGKIPEYASDKYSKESFEIAESSHHKPEKSRQDHGRRHVFEPQIVSVAEKPQKPISPPREEIEQIEASVKRKQLRELLLQEQQNVFVKNEPEVELIHESESEESETESSSIVESSSEEEQETIPRLKPIFIPKNERITVSHDDETEKEQDIEIVEERRRAETKELISKLIKEEETVIDEGIGNDQDVITDDDDEETAFEQWKVRELRRIKRDFEEAEAIEAEKEERLKLRTMTEEERAAHFAANPRVITNFQEKGTYSFLQKYYHRGAFYLDVDDSVLKQNFAAPTLDDHFDKSVLPKVMQVKNFGKRSRTKYTHLVDQDTSCFIGPWSKKNELTNVIAHKIGGGFKQQFDRPSLKRKKYE